MGGDQARRSGEQVKGQGGSEGEGKERSRATSGCEERREFRFLNPQRASFCRSSKMNEMYSQPQTRSHLSKPL